MKIIFEEGEEHLKQFSKTIVSIKTNTRLMTHTQAPVSEQQKVFDELEDKIWCAVFEHSNPLKYNK